MVFCSVHRSNIRTSQQLAFVMYFTDVLGILRNIKWMCTQGLRFYFYCFIKGNKHTTLFFVTGSSGEEYNAKTIVPGP